MKTKTDIKLDPLSNLPIDLGHLIFKQLPTYSFLSLASTNKKLAQLANNEELVLKKSGALIDVMQRSYDQYQKLYDDLDYQPDVDIYYNRFFLLAQRLKKNQITGVDEFLTDKGYSNSFFQDYGLRKIDNKDLHTHLGVTLILIIGTSLILCGILVAIFSQFLAAPLALILTFTIGFGIGTFVGILCGLKLHIDAINPPMENISAIEEIIKEKTDAEMMDNRVFPHIQP